MFQLINVSINYARLNHLLRAAFFEATRHLVITWGARNDRANACQSACRATLQGEGFEWDSGWVEKKEMCLTCDAPLPEGISLKLSLTIRDDAGNESKTYQTSLFNASVTWRASWIAPEKDEPGRTIYLRREFTITRPLKSAVLYACGIGYQKLSLNGEDLDNTLDGGAVLDPATTDYSRTCQYVVYPYITRELVQGQNCLGALVGEGWRRNVLLKGDRPENTRPYAGRPCFTAMLHLSYQDGTEEWILTDEAWQTGHGAHVRNDIFDGEVYDANFTAEKWDEPGFTSFAPAVIVPGPGGRMRPMTLTPIVRQKEHHPIAMWPMGENAFMIDLGQNIAGVPWILLPKLSKGQVVTIRTAEELEEDGSLYTAPLRQAKATDTYIASGDKRDLIYWRPLFTYHGFRYAMVEGLGSAFDPYRIGADELHTEMETDSFFRCGDALATRIHELCVATERANQHHLLTDCPQRDERQGWMNDATVRFEETPYNFDISRIFPKIIRDIIDTQDEAGAITCTAPYVYGFRPADPVCSSFLVAGHQAYLHTGNREIIREAFDAWQAWENCLLAHSENYIVTYGHYGDWAAPVYACKRNSMGDGAESAVTPAVYMSTGYSFFNCRLLASFAAILGKAEEQQKWLDTAERVKAAMLEKWYDPLTATMATGSQAAQAFALWLGILPEVDAPRAARLLHDDLVRQDFRFTTGNLCTRYMMDVLTRYGYLEDAWKLITRTEYPSIGFMIQNEATTVWERFELKKDPGMNSHDHPMYGAVDYWFYAYLCGVRPAGPAWEEFTVEPFFPEDLLSVQCAIDTVKGQVAVRWMKRYGALHLHVTVPFGTTARITFGGGTHTVGSGFHTYSVPLSK